MNKFIAVSYYTKNTSYQAEVKSLVSSLERFSVEYDILPVETMGSWQANTIFKASFILDMIKKHRPRPIVWLDADSVITRDPIFLNMIDADVAFYYRTNGGRVPRINENCELISASMFFKTNEQAERLVQMWIELNKKGGRDLEQHNLQQVIPGWRKTGGIHAILPQAYCKIFDSDVDHITIVQNQASRRFRSEVDQ